VSAGPDSSVARLRARAQRAYREARLARFYAGYMAAIWDPWGPPDRVKPSRVAVAMARAAVDGALAPDAVDLAYLDLFKEEDASGPVQRDEAILLYGLIRVLRPRTLVELGFLRGHSAFNFLQAMDPEAVLYSFDSDPEADDAARTIAGRDPRLRFAVRSQDEIGAADVDGRPVDFLFIDASHDLEINRRTFAAIEGLLAPRAVVAVHDTGAWTREAVNLAPQAVQYAAANPSYWLSTGDFAHRPDEREFVNWIRETRPDFGQLQLHSRATLRHGLTLLQAGGPLEM
jgi:predicted O-methyltransferase YrrM